MRRRVGCPRCPAPPQRPKRSESHEDQPAPCTLLAQPSSGSDRDRTPEQAKDKEAWAASPEISSNVPIWAAPFGSVLRDSRLEHYLRMLQHVDLLGPVVTTGP